MEPGTRLGAFEVLGPLGAGGMGEVYRAKDTRLGREVALKTLPATLAADPERLARLRKEARILASLSHPHIATLFGLEETDGATVLVMELVQGQTLADRLHRGALNLGAALELARQIATGLEAAHERGILHRDLKPSNIAIDPKGQVKLLDFGLAKARAGDGADAPTESAASSGAATVVGTAPYMSPEQARGEALDKRTDVWAFGCVLYEMLTGNRAFPGATPADATAAVIEKEPDWTALPGETPASVRSLLRLCLQKDRAERLHDIADARLELKEAHGALASGETAAAAAATARRRGTTGLWLSALGVAAAGGALAAALLMPRASAPPRGTRLTLVPPVGVELIDADPAGPHLALSPSGEQVAFRATSSEGTSLYVHALDALEARRIPRTGRAYSPFYSPDGRWLGFYEDGRLRKLLLDGGARVTIADLPGGGPSLRGASWGADGLIVLCPGAGPDGLWHVPAEGGTPLELTRPDPGKGEYGHRWPQILPGGRAVLFTVITRSLRAADARIEALVLETGERRLLVEGSGYARYVPSGHLLYAVLDTVLAAPFDVQRLEVTGTAVPVLDDVQVNYWGHLYADVEVSDQGSLAYVPGFHGPVARSLLWVNREGKVEPVTSRRAAYWRPRLSPDGRELAVDLEASPGSWDVWRLDLERELWTRVTFDGRSGQPEWSPDAASIAFMQYTAAGADLVRAPAAGGAPPESLDLPPGNIRTSGWSPDGTALVFQQQRSGSKWDIGLLPLRGAPRFLLAAPHTEASAAVSPDGRWMAYVSNEAGRPEVYVRPFPGPGPKHAVSPDGGAEPRWSRNGRELFYRTRGERPKLMSVSVDVEQGFVASSLHAVMDDVFFEWGDYDPPTYDVSPDGRRFVFLERPTELPAPRKLVVIPDFAAEIEAKLHAAGR